MKTTCLLVLSLVVCSMVVAPSYQAPNPFVKREYSAECNQGDFEYSTKCFTATGSAASTEVFEAPPIVGDGSQANAELPVGTQSSTFEPTTIGYSPTETETDGSGDVANIPVPTESITTSMVYSPAETEADGSGDAANIPVPTESTTKGYSSIVTEAPSDGSGDAANIPVPTEPTSKGYSPAQTETPSDGSGDASNVSVTTETEPATKGYHSPTESSSDGSGDAANIPVPTETESATYSSKPTPYNIFSSMWNSVTRRRVKRSLNARWYREPASSERTTTTAFGTATLATTDVISTTTQCDTESVTPTPEPTTTSIAAEPTEGA